MKLTAIVSALLDWFSTNARDLPWRRTQDPYAIWVSEIMLQQTQVKTVIPYWERWMKSLPTLHAVADASPATIHKLWEGLGYYTRVRNLQQAAREIIVRHSGTFPRAHQDILALRGIGPYTAGAISSIAFNEPQPILDGNVIRVLTRVFGIAENPREKSANKKLWQLAAELVAVAGQAAPPQCSHLNQSLMELGALICTPRNPRCLLCPLRDHCVAYRTNRIEQLPNLGPRTVATARFFIAFAVENRGCFLVRQRSADVVNAHLWEFPNAETSATPPADLAEFAHATFGLRLALPAALCTIKHSITRYRITVSAFHAKSANRTPLPESRWLDLAQLDSLAFTSAHRKIYTRLVKTIASSKKL